MNSWLFPPRTREVQVDEKWGFVFKKEASCDPLDPLDRLCGDDWDHTAVPLAVPIVLGGVRVATVAAIGMATIAAAIGAKGLGGYIFRGVALADPQLILLGAVPAALLALACDAALGEIEHVLDPTRPRHSRARALIASSAIVALVALAGWGLWLERPTVSRSATIVVGSKDGSEMITLGHMLADLVETETPLRVDRRFNLGGHAGLLQCLETRWAGCLHRIHRHCTHNDPPRTPRQRPAPGA